MIKFLPVLIILIVIAAVIGYRSISSSPGNGEIKEEASPLTEVPVTSPLTSTSSDDSRIKRLEEIVSGLTKSGTGTQNSSSLENRVKTLEMTVTQMQGQINSLKPATAQTTPAASKQAPLYIPLGSGGTLNDQNWLALSTYEVLIDPADYPGYSNMQLEVNMRLVQTAGEAKARLYNVTDGSDIANSEVTVTADKATLGTSHTFTLPTGRKTYRLQAKSTQGFTLELQTARIKVNF